MKYLTLAFGLVLIAPVLQAAPQPFQAVYTVTAKGITLGDMFQQSCECEAEQNE